MSKEEKTPSFSDVMSKAAASAVRGGTAGAIAMGANVGALMVCSRRINNIESLRFLNVAILSPSSHNCLLTLMLL